MTTDNVGSRRIKVVECIDSFGAGGTELNLLRTIERLDADRFDRFLIALNDSGSLRKRFAQLGIPIEVFSFPRLNSLSALRQAMAIVRWLHRVKPDVVHSHDLYTNLFVTPCARLAGVPLVVTSRRWWTAMPRRIHRTGNNFAYRISHKVIANSAAVAELLVREEGIPASRIVTLPNFVDDDAFEDVPDAVIADVRRSLGIPAQAIVVTVVAMFRPEKDLETVIKAVASLNLKCPNLHLMLIGSGPNESTLKQAAVSHGAQNRVHFPGFLASPPNLHFFGDIAVLCSLHEGFPNSIVEAMAAGKPVVATNVGGIPDAVEDGRTGFLVPPQAPEALAAVLYDLVRNEHQRRLMGAAGRLKARKSYAASTILAQLNLIYSENIQV